MPDTTSDSASGGEHMPMITRVVIENYKSIAHCDMRLGPLVLLAAGTDWVRATSLMRFASLPTRSARVWMRPCAAVEKRFDSQFGSCI